MKILFFKTLCFFSFFCSLDAGIENYFKKVEGKEDIYLNQMRNIDFIYTINLDQRPEKFTHCLDELTPFNIYPYRFSAVNGWELSLESLNKLGVVYQDGMCKNLWGTAYLPEGDFNPYHEIMNVKGRNYFCHCMSRGAVGISLSHLSILQDAYDAGYKTIWVMEDDIQVIKNPHIISHLIDELNEFTKRTGGWDILFTDQDTKNQRGEYVPCRSYARRPNFTPKNIERFNSVVNIRNKFRKVGARYGAYSMIVNRSGMKKILTFFKTYGIFLPYDMDFCLPDNISLYSVINDVISTQPQALSDNGAANYRK